MAFDAFLRLDKIEGEVERTDEMGSIPITSFNWGVNNPSSVGAGTTGAGAGKATISSFNVTKLTDKASPMLFQECCKGTHFDKATVSLYKAGGESPLLFLTLEFDKLYITDMQWAGSSGIGGDVPEESLSFSFGVVKLTYTTQSDEGTAADNITGGWDQINAKVPE